MTTHFSLLVDGKRHPVCKVTFMDVFRVTKDRILTVCSKMQAGDLTLSDKRGRHSKTKVDPDVKDRIRAHIQSFPTYESHYGRRNGQNSGKYLPQELNLTKMYSLFIEQCREYDNSEAEQWVYTDIFRKDFKLSFLAPKLDTCDTCDSLTARIGRSVDQSVKDDLTTQRNGHIRMSEFKSYKSPFSEYSKS